MGVVLVERVKVHQAHAPVLVLATFWGQTDLGSFLLLACRIFLVATLGRGVASYDRTLSLSLPDARSQNICITVSAENDLRAHAWKFELPVDLYHLNSLV